MKKIKRVEELKELQQELQQRWKFLQDAITGDLKALKESFRPRNLIKGFFSGARS